MATFNFDLDLEVVPFQCQMHISVKVHCGKTADNYFEMLTRDHEIVSRGHEIVSRGHEIANSWPRDTKSWPRVSKSWPRDTKSWPRDRIFFSTCPFFATVDTLLRSK